MPDKSAIIDERLRKLESHIEQEIPILSGVIQSFQVLDQIGYRMGLLDTDNSFATQISWWPLISVLGTFSAGKSSFINYFLGYPLQTSGNQAVDDKFTLMTYSREDNFHVLPGLALDADPRFPFYQFSHEIEHVAKGEGRKIDTYLQLKTCPSKQLSGKILIDSPGFDADSQRTSTLRITDHIVNLSDLVLIFFDARHPEPGAMKDTLEHLVAKTVKRPDSSKFLFILNQIDTAAKEDNPEAVISAWQRAMAQYGMTTGRFYTIYNPDICIHIEDKALRERFESKRDTDLQEIHYRIREVEVARTYRIVGTLERTARDFEERVVDTLNENISLWRNITIGLDVIIFGSITVLAPGFMNPETISSHLTEGSVPSIASLIISVMVVILLHFSSRKMAATAVIYRLKKRFDNYLERRNMIRAFKTNTLFWRSIFSSQPIGWGNYAKQNIHRVLSDANKYIQTLNDRYTNPAGEDDTPTSDQQKKSVD